MVCQRDLHALEMQDDLEVHPFRVSGTSRPWNFGFGHDAKYQTFRFHPDQESSETRGFAVWLGQFL